MAVRAYPNAAAPATPNGRPHATAVSVRPRRRRARWAASSGGAAGGASWKGQSRRRGRASRAAHRVHTSTTIRACVVIARAGRQASDCAQGRPCAWVACCGRAKAAALAMGCVARRAGRQCIVVGTASGGGVVFRAQHSHASSSSHASRARRSGMVIASPPRWRSPSPPLAVAAAGSALLAQDWPPAIRLVQALQPEALFDVENVYTDCFTPSNGSHWNRFARSERLASEIGRSHWWNWRIAGASMD